MYKNARSISNNVTLQRYYTSCKTGRSAKISLITAGAPHEIRTHISRNRTTMPNPIRPARRVWWKRSELDRHIQEILVSPLSQFLSNSVLFNTTFHTVCHIFNDWTMSAFRTRTFRPKIISYGFGTFNCATHSNIPQSIWRKAECSKLNRYQSTRLAGGSQSKMGLLSNKFLTISAFEEACQVVISKLDNYLLKLV